MAYSYDKYCKKCGALLKAKKIPVGYSPSTGKANNRIDVVCPNGKLPPLDGHTKGSIMYGNTRDIYYCDDDEADRIIFEYEKSGRQ